jgi:hypothetical protein
MPTCRERGSARLVSIDTTLSRLLWLLDFSAASSPFSIAARNYGNGEAVFLFDASQFERPVQTPSREQLAKCLSLPTPRSSSNDRCKHRHGSSWRSSLSSDYCWKPATRVMVRGFAHQPAIGPLVDGGFWTRLRPTWRLRKAKLASSMQVGHRPPSAANLPTMLIRKSRPTVYRLSSSRACGHARHQSMVTWAVPESRHSQRHIWFVCCSQIK